MSGPAIAFEGVSKRFGQKVLALDGVSWRVEQGARACLLGPNGAGKSTSIRLLEGALTPTAGEVRLLGARANGPEYPAARRKTGIVPQNPGVYRDLTAGEYLDLARRLYGRLSLGPVVDLLGLGPQLGKMLAQLSGGYQRRVAVAAALLAEPDVLLLDEPTVGLDPVAVHDLHAYLREAMSRAGRTTLLCTHNLAEAEALCEQVVILRAGRVVLHDSLANLRRRTRPQVRLAARQGAEALMAAVRRRGLEARLEDERNDGAVLVGLEQPEAAAPDLLRGLLTDGLDVFECTPVEASLEAVFLDVVRGDSGVEAA